MGLVARIRLVFGRTGIARPVPVANAPTTRTITVPISVL